MFYKKYLFLSIFQIFSLASVLYGQTTELPNPVITPQTPFLNKILSFKDLEAKIFLSSSSAIVPTRGTIFNGTVQEIIKSNDSVFLLLERSGVVYLLDPVIDSASTYSFHRLDHTININYNIDANNFLYQNHLYSYGGYGFWRLNGQLRSYNFTDKEWDIVPVNDEIISNGNNWVSKKEGKIYVPFQTIMNASIRNNPNALSSRLSDSYYLDLNLLEWKKIGSLTNKAKKLVVDNNITNSLLSTDKGFLFLYNDEAYHFDFLNNKIFKSNNSELNQYLIRRTSNNDLFFYKDSLYSYSPSTNRFDQRSLSMKDFSELDYAIWGLENDYYYLTGTLLFIFLLVYISIKIYKKRVKKKVEQSNLKILKTKTVGQVFVGVELSLIHLLLEAATMGIHVEIGEVNHVLGLKDKNIGLQKKVRSDVINTVNEKYAIIVNNEIQLISSIRKEEDKRYYEYFINDSELKSIKKILERK